VENAEDAWAAAQEIGLPVVVKPQYGNQGRGVATNLATKEQVLAAYAAAREEESTILVEQFAPGGDYRLLVVGDKMVAAARREPAQVIGDGVHSVEDLVQITNDDPRRGDDHATSLSKIVLDAVALQVLGDQGLVPASIPADGTRVIIRRNANLSTGGTATDVTELVHPDVAARAIEAARVVGLDVAGVDVVALDISSPLEAQRGVVVEVNAAPGLRMHLKPSVGKSRPVGEAIVGTLFAPGETGRIPIIAVTGVNGKTTTTRFISHILRGTGRRVGMTCTEGIYIDQRRIQSGDCSGPQSAQNILLNPSIDAAVLETARGGILRAGLGFDRCDVAVVTNIGEGDHLGLADIDTLEKLARVKRTVVEELAPTGSAVLNATDPLVAEMAGKSPAPIVYFSIVADNPIIMAHRTAGGRAVTVRDGIIMLCEGELEIPLVRLDRVPLTQGGRIAFQTENTLAAVGAAWSLGLTREAIRSGLESFAADIEHIPGRFNLLDIGGVTVIVDYGHNPSSLIALTAAMDQFPHERRTAVYTCAGDRRDCDMIRQGELLGRAFDRVVLYEDHYVRGRKEGEIMSLLKQGLNGAKRALEIQEIRGSVAAIEMALASVRPGELLMIQADTIDETVDYVRRYLATHKNSHEISLLEVVDGRLPDTMRIDAASRTPESAAIVMTAQSVD
jgi:cyanophycin synthetase